MVAGGGVFPMCWERQRDRRSGKVISQEVDPDLERLCRKGGKRKTELERKGVER